MNNNGIRRMQGNIVPSISSSVMNRVSGLPPTEAMSNVAKSATTDSFSTVQKTDTLPVIYAQGPSSNKGLLAKASDFLASLRTKKPDLKQFEALKERAFQLEKEVIPLSEEVASMTPQVKASEKKIAAWQIYFAERENDIKVCKEEVVKNMSDKSLGNDDKLAAVLQAKAVMESNPSSERCRELYKQKREIFDISNTIAMTRFNELIAKRNKIETEEKAYLTEKADIESQIEKFRSFLSNEYMPKARELMDKRKELRQVNQQIIVIREQIAKLSSNK